MSLRQNLPTDEKSTEETKPQSFDVPSIVKPKALHGGNSLLDKEFLKELTTKADDSDDVFESCYKSRRHSPIPYSLTVLEKSLYAHYNDEGKPAVLAKGGTAIIKVAQKFELKQVGENKELVPGVFDCVKIIKPKRKGQIKTYFDLALGEAEMWQKLYPTGGLYVTTSAKTGLIKFKLFMERAKGEDLHNHIFKRTLYNNEKKLLEVCFKITKIVQLLLNSGYLHRDIKLENIMLDIATGEVTLIDYGFAIHKDKACKNRVGTREYMAPELYTSQPPVYSESTEVFAMGVVFQAILLRIIKEVNKQGEIETVLYRTQQLIGSECIMVVAYSDEYYTIDHEIYRLTEAMIDKDPAKRPTLEQVTKKLEEALRTLSPELPVVSSHLKEFKDEAAAPTLIDLLNQAVPVTRIKDKSKEEQVEYLVFSDKASYEAVLRELPKEGLLKHNDFTPRGLKIDDDLELDEKYALEIMGRIKIQDGKVVICDPLPASKKSPRFFCSKEHLKMIANKCANEAVDFADAFCKAKYF